MHLFNIQDDWRTRFLCTTNYGIDKCHQISLSGPWSATYDLGWIKLSKIKSDGLCFRRMFWKSSLYMSTSSLVLIPRIQRVLVIIFNRAENRSSTLVWKSRGDCCLKSSKENQIILYSQHLPRKTLAYLHQEKKKNTLNIVKITFSRGNYNIFPFFFVLLIWDADQGLSKTVAFFSNSKQNIYVWNLKLQDYREEHKRWCDKV